MTEPLHPQPLLEARNLSRSFDGGRIEALRGVNLSIAKGDFAVITGPSGSGKSTLLQLLGGLDSPTSGEVLFDGSPLCGLDGSRGQSGSKPRINLDAYRSRHVGFIFQAFHLMPTLRAIENVQIPMLANGSGSRARLQKAEALLEEMGVAQRMGHYPNELSAGERQRVAIARALANDPQLLLADEPTGNLDTANSCRIMEILTGLQAARGMTLVIVTHEDEIAAAAPRHIRMRDGLIEAPVAEVRGAIG
jgi:putative ABC transport system ATP-binding protein